MDVAFSKIVAAIMRGENNIEVLSILNAVAFFAPGEIRSRMFSSLIPDRTQRIAVIEILQRHSIVRVNSKGNSFFISDSTQVKLRKYLENTHLTESLLDGTIDYLKKVKTPGDYPHLMSVYNHAKLYPKLLENLDTLPGNIVFGMNQSGKLEEAMDFGTECKEFLMKTFGKYHGMVLHLESAIGHTLLKLENRDAAVKVLTAAYYKACVTLEVSETSAYMELLAKAILKYNPLGSLRAEDSLREIVFLKKSATESWSHSELQKWTQYAEIISSYDLATAAISILDDVCKQRQQIFGPYDDNICDVMIIKAECLSLASRFSDALHVLRTIIKERTSKFGEWHWSLFKVRYNMAKVLKKMEFWNLSIEILEELVIMLEMIIGKNTGLFLKAVLEIAKISMLQRDFEKALKVSSDLYDKLVRVFGVGDLMCFECAMIMGESWLQLNQPEKALKVFEEILEISENYDNGVEDISRVKSMVLKIKNMEYNAPSGTLHAFVREGNLEEVLSFIKKEENIESKDTKGMTLLQYAIAFGRVEVAKALIKRGAKYPSKLPSQLTPLEGSEMHKLLETVNSFFDFVKAGDNERVKDAASKENCVLGARDSQGCTALHWAALHAHLDVLKGLLKLGCDPTMVSDKGNSPLHIAASKGHVGIAEAILRSMGPAKVAALLDGRTGSGGNTPLHAAAEKGHLGVVKALMAHGAVYCPVNAVDKTPIELCKDSECQNLLMIVEKLFSGVTKGEVESVGRMLEELDKKDVLAVLGARNEENKTLIQVAMKHKHLELTKNIVKLLKYDLEL